MNSEKNILFLFIILISYGSVFSQEQNMENKIEKLKALGKDSIIKIASNIVQKKYPDLKINLNDFKMTAWSNKKEVLVHFKRLITFIPLGKGESDFNYHLSVNILTEDVNPFDSWGMDRFYLPTEEDIKKIEFVKKAYNLPHSGFDNEISEMTDMYVIHISNDVAFGIYHIDKITGKEVQGSIEGSYVPPPEEITEDIINEDPLIEIKN